MNKREISNFQNLLFSFPRKTIRHKSIKRATCQRHLTIAIPKDSHHRMGLLHQSGGRFRCHVSRILPIRRPLRSLRYRCDKCDIHVAQTGYVVCVPGGSVSENTG